MRASLVFVGFLVEGRPIQGQGLRTFHRAGTGPRTGTPEFDGTPADGTWPDLVFHGRLPYTRWKSLILMLARSSLVTSS